MKKRVSFFIIITLFVLGMLLNISTYKCNDSMDFDDVEDIEFIEV